jgi:hypothetical protein
MFTGEDWDREVMRKWKGAGRTDENIGTQPPSRGEF